VITQKKENHGLQKKNEINDNLSLDKQNSISSFSVSNLIGIQRARLNPQRLTSTQAIQLQRAIGNQNTSRVLSRTPQTNVIQRTIWQWSDLNQDWAIYHKTGNMEQPLYTGKKGDFYDNEGTLGKYDLSEQEAEQAKQTIKATKTAQSKQQVGPLISSSNSERKAHPFIISEIFKGFEKNSIPYKIGGSIAAKLLGARRAPRDLELEMPSKQLVDKGQGFIKSMCDFFKINIEVITIGKFGFSLRLNGNIKNNTTQENEPVRFEIDIMNENSDEMNQQLDKPEMMDAILGDETQELVGVERRSRLIVNYADRSVNKFWTAREKQDYHQIYDLFQGQDKDALLNEVKLHGNTNTNFDIGDIVRGQYKVSQYVSAAENKGWIKQGIVKQNSHTTEENQDIQKALQEGWLINDNGLKVNTKYGSSSW